MTTAPKITLEQIEQNIEATYYFTAAQGALSPLVDEAVKANAVVHPSLNLLTICVLVLKNGFTVVGTSACVSPENFDEQVGRDIAREKAVDQIWPLMGYALKEKTFLG